MCRAGEEEDYEARVVAVAADADCALLTVPDEEFWEGLQAVEFGPLPGLQVCGAGAVAKDCGMGVHWDGVGAAAGSAVEQLWWG